MERAIRISRPYMPGYGTLPANEGAGLLPWSWAEERLVASRNYWLTSVWPNRGPHSMPVWGMWHENAFLFSSSKPSRKAKNLGQNPRCVVATEDALNPVVVEGVAELLTKGEDLELLLALEDAKNETDYKINMLDPAVSSGFRELPRWEVGQKDGDFTL